MQTIGTFTLIKNEEPFIRAHLLSWLPWVDEMVFFDGGSTDGTLDIIKSIGSPKVKVFEGKDPADLQDDYVRLFNECLRSLSTDYAIFAHPDMILDDPGDLWRVGDSVSYTTNIRSFAGEPGGPLCEIVSGRGPKWKNIYRLHRPDLGCHYFGWYGSAEEDCYFSQITGDEHLVHWGEGGCDYLSYPYCIKDSSAKILHYSDVRPLERRIDRMVKCLVNCGFSAEEAQKKAESHPRVTFKDGDEFKFAPAEYHSIFKVAA